MSAHSFKVDKLEEKAEEDVKEGLLSIHEGITERLLAEIHQVAVPSKLKALVFLLDHPDLVTASIGRAVLGLISEVYLNQSLLMCAALRVLRVVSDASLINETVHKLSTLPFKSLPPRIAADALNALVSLSKNVLELENVLALLPPLLASPSHLLRSAALRGLLAWHSSQPIALSHCLAYFDDGDPRVRALAVSLLTERVGVLPDSLVPTAITSAVAALADDADEVRQEALLLLWKLCQAHTGLVVHPKPSSQMTLLAYAFLKLSDCVTDVSRPLRAKACALLGTMGLIDPTLALQTLSKSVRPPTSSANESIVVPAPLQEGQATVDQDALKSAQGDAMDVDATPGIVEFNDPHLAVAAAAGAFVHGLEDEFEEVRSAAIGAMAALALHSREFSRDSVPALVDMLNDEIVGVRIETLNALCALNEVIVFDDDQLQIVLASLEDAHAPTRAAVYLLLSRTRLSTPKAFEKTLHSLLNVTMVKYPNDKRQIYACLASLGREHAAVVGTLVNSLLGVSPNFTTREGNVHDERYVGVLVAIAHAQTKHPLLARSYPAFVVPHFEHLHRVYPDLVPPEIVKKKSPVALEVSESLGELLNTLRASLLTSMGSCADLHSALVLIRRFHARLRSLQTLQHKEAAIDWLTAACEHLLIFIFYLEKPSKETLAAVLKETFTLLHCFELPHSFVLTLYNLINFIGKCANAMKPPSSHLLSKWLALDEPWSTSLDLSALLELVPLLDCKSCLSSLLLSSSTPANVEFQSILPQTISLRLSMPLIDENAMYAIMIEYADGRNAFYQIIPSTDERTHDVALEQGNWSEPCTVHISLIRITHVSRSNLVSALRSSDTPQEGLDFTVLSPKIALRIHPSNGKK